MKELTVADDHGDVCVTMWNEVATCTVTTSQKRMHIRNSVCDYCTYKRRMIVKVNEVQSIQVYIYELTSITCMLTTKILA